MADDEGQPHRILGLFLTLLIVAVVLVTVLFVTRGRSGGNLKVTNVEPIEPKALQGANGEVLTSLPYSVSATVTFQWNPNPEPDVIGYKLHWGTVPGVYTQSFSTGRVTTASVSGFTPGITYFFVLEAQNSAGLWSPYSSEISWTIPASSSPTPTPTATFTPTPTATAAATVTPTITPTPSPTVTPSATPSPSPDFSLTVSPGSRIIPPFGGFASYSVTVVPVNGFTSGVILNASGLPFGTANAGRLGTGVLTIYIGPCAPAGTYPLTITGVSCTGNLVHTINATLIKQ